MNDRFEIDLFNMEIKLKFNGVLDFEFIFILDKIKDIMKLNIEKIKVEVDI